MAELLSGSESSIPEAITSKINEVFGKADESDLAEIGETPATEPTEPSPKEVSRRQSVVKEQAAELDEEGLTGPDHPEGQQKQEKPEAQEGVEAEAEAEQPATETPTLDPTLRFVASEYGWKQEDIDAFHESNPELAQKTFERMADAYTNLSRQVLALGGSPVAPGTQPQNQPAAQPEAAPATPLDKLLSPEALASFAETNGQEIVDSFLKPFAQERNALQQEVRELKGWVEVQKRQVVAQEATSVLDTLGKQYADVYGQDRLKLSDGQQQARKNVAQLADQLRSGARQQGYEMSVTDALNRAHLLFTSDKRVADGRKQVQEQVQKRNKQITAKPTQRRSKLMTAKSDDAAAEAIAKFWADKGVDAE